MLKRIVHAALLTLCVGFGAPAKAEDGRLDPAFVKPLMAWVEAQTHVHVPQLPNVIISNDKLSQLAGNRAAEGGRVRALYVPGMVVIDEYFWDDSSTQKISFLVHELVHHAQLYNGRKYACHDAKETEAYTLQNEWLRQQGRPPAIPEWWIAKMSICPIAYGRS